MGGNANTALSYILLGALAYTINKTGAANILARKISQLVRGNKLTLSLIIIPVSYTHLDVYKRQLLNVIDMKLFEVIKNIDTLIKMNILEEVVVDNKALIKFSYIAYKDRCV